MLLQYSHYKLTLCSAVELQIGHVGFHWADLLALCYALLGIHKNKTPHGGLLTSIIRVAEGNTHTRIGAPVYTNHLWQAQQQHLDDLTSAVLHELDTQTRQQRTLDTQHAASAEVHFELQGMVDMYNRLRQVRTQCSVEASCGWPMTQDTATKRRYGTTISLPS